VPLLAFFAGPALLIPPAQPLRQPETPGDR